ncbi:hypothetical protein V6N13_095021 [Hibiscus sabdariffa]|uniref:Uncharacterized protein n=1 Tax=Hibiscus sabdariffa TaxID=183260 RepID=A0ABR2PSW4_9ROSI
MDGGDQNVAEAAAAVIINPSDEIALPNHSTVVPEQVKRWLPQENLASQGQGEEEHPDLQNDENTGEENEFSFELRALEVALEATCSFLDARTRELETDTYPALDELTSMVFSFFLSLDLFIAA